MGKFEHWRDDEIVNGEGKNLMQHAADLTVGVSGAASSALCAELRNVLVPLKRVIDEGMGDLAARAMPKNLAQRQVERLFALAEAFEEKARAVGHDVLPPPSTILAAGEVVPSRAHEWPEGEPRPPFAVLISGGPLLPGSAEALKKFLTQYQEGKDVSNQVVVLESADGRPMKMGLMPLVPPTSVIGPVSQDWRAQKAAEEFRVAESPLSKGSEVDSVGVRKTVPGSPDGYKTAIEAAYWLPRVSITTDEQAAVSRVKSAYYYLTPTQRRGSPTDVVQDLDVAIVSEMRRARTWQASVQSSYDPHVRAVVEAVWDAWSHHTWPHIPESSQLGRVLNAALNLARAHAAPGEGHDISQTVEDRAHRIVEAMLSAEETVGSFSLEDYVRAGLLGRALTKNEAVTDWSGERAARRRPVEWPKHVRWEDKVGESSFLTGRVRVVVNEGVEGWRLQVYTSVRVIAPRGTPLAAAKEAAEKFFGVEGIR